MQISLSFEKFDEVLNGSKVSNGMHFLSFLFFTYYNFSRDFK